MQQNNSKVLVVDDNPDNLRVVSHLLGKQGYQIALALNGESAIETLQANPVDLILLDVMMPDIDGFEVCKRLKEEPETAKIPIIFLTAKTETEDIVKAFQLGGVDYIPKPFRREELLVRVKNHIERFNSRKIIEQQTKELSSANQRMMDSVRYTERIQSVILQSENELFEKFSDGFLIHKPKDIVSGDFFWSTHLNQRTCLVLADCTGHGIPSAYLSVLGLTLLNQMPIGLLQKEPSAILEHLRLNVKTSLKQTSFDSPVVDGFDMAVVLFDWEKMTASFSGANINLHILKAGISKLSTMKSDSMPVSVWLREEPFSNHLIQLNRGDQFYLYSDGLQDSHNPLRKRFGSKRVIQLLEKNHNQPLASQKTAVEKKLSDWQSNADQTDDITIIGIRI